MIKRVCVLFLASLTCLSLMPSCRESKMETQLKQETDTRFNVAYYRSFDMVAPGVQANIEHMVEMAGGKITYVTMRLDPDGIINMVEEIIALDCDGFFLMPTNDSVMVSVSRRCEEAGVYFASLFRQVFDPEVLEILEANPYWCGWVIDDDEDAAFQVGRMLFEMGMKQIAAINLNIGDAAGDARERGLLRAAEEYGMEIMSIERQPSDAAETTKICESFMASFPQLDCIVNLSTYVICGVEAMCSAVVNAGKQDRIKIATCDFYMSQQDYWDQGVIVCGRGGQPVFDNMMCMAMLINAITGNPVNGDEPTYITSNNVYVTNGDDLREWYTYVENEDEIKYPFTDDEIESMLLKQFNNDIDLESFQQVATGWGFEFFRKKK